MKNKTTVAIKAAKYALGISASYILVPPFINLIEGVEISGNMMAQRVLVGATWFIIIFIGLFINWMRSGSDKNRGDTDSPHVSKKVSKWNFVFIIIAPLALWFFFGQSMIEGKLENRYWLGVIFWVSIIFVSGRNILLALKQKPST